MSKYPFVRTFKLLAVWAVITITSELTVKLQATLNALIHDKKFNEKVSTDFVELERI